MQKWLQIDQLRDFLLIECLGLVSLQGQGEESKDVEETKIGLELKLKCVRTWEFIILSPLFLFIFVIFYNKKLKKKPLTVVLVLKNDGAMDIVKVVMELSGQIQDTFGNKARFCCWIRIHKVAGKKRNQRRLSSILDQTIWVDETRDQVCRDSRALFWQCKFEMPIGFPSGNVE